MANSSDNVKRVNRVAKDIEKLLERKADEYGSFTKTSYFFHGFLFAQSLERQS